MMKYKILVPLDGSALSESVLPFLRLLASKANVEAELLRCFEPPAVIYTMPELILVDDHFLSDDNLIARMESYLRARQASLAGVTSRTLVCSGPPAGEILSRSKDNDLVLIATHGRRGLGRLLLGSVTANVARSCLKPVIVVAGDAKETPSLDTILVGLDGSPFAERAVAAAVELAGTVGAELILYRAVPARFSALDPEAEMEEATLYLEKVKRKYPSQAMSCVVKRTDGRVDIVERAESLGVDLVVIGSHGLRDVARWVLGSVAEDVLHQARCPIMVVH